MRKKTLLLGAVIFCLSTLNAQNSWNKSGNSISDNDFIGTTNNKDLVFKTNGMEGFRLRTDNTMFYGVKVIYDDVIKFKIFRNGGANFDRLVAVDKVGNLKLATAPILENLTISNNFTASNGITFADGTVQTTASANSEVWSLNGSNIHYNTGKVSIGLDPNQANALTGDYKLYVGAGILTEKIKVALRNSSDWADYVFDDNYELMSLNDVEKFVDENNHLPGIPSAEDVKKSGIDVAKMDAKLLEKIEELTLYIIDMQKEITILKNELEKK